jgi:hypothetical protein
VIPFLFAAMAAGECRDHRSCLTSDVETLQTFDWNIWLVNHGAEVTRPPLDKIIAALKEQGVRTFGASGYCFGVRYAMDLAFENITKAIVISHPSFLQIPEDLEMRGLPILVAELVSVEGCSDIEGAVQQSHICQLLRVRRGRFSVGQPNTHAGLLIMGYRCSQLRSRK